jgi:hypothetical protein
MVDMKIIYAVFGGSAIREGFGKLIIYSCLHLLEKLIQIVRRRPSQARGSSNGT